MLAIATIITPATSNPIFIRSNLLEYLIFVVLMVETSIVIIKTDIASAVNCSDNETIVVKTIDIKKAVLGFIKMDKIMANDGKGIINTDISSGKMTAQDVIKIESRAIMEIYCLDRYCFSKY